MRQLTITPSITHRESVCVEKYLQDISKADMITPEEETRLARLIKAGDEAARNALTKANLRFVVSVAKKYQFRGLSLSDLINEGNIGLIKAAQRFDETKGFKFISYAVWWIRQSIIQALNEQARMVRLPSNRCGMANRVQEAICLLEQVHERAPSAEELADTLQMPLADVQSVNDYSYRYVSLDAPLSATNDDSLLDQMANNEVGSTDTSVDHTQSLSIEISRCLATLDEKQRNILCCFFGIGMLHPMSLEEIGLQYDVTHERIRQLKDKAIRLLRTSKKVNLLRSYLGT